MYSAFRPVELIQSRSLGPGHFTCFALGMTRDTPNPNTRHRTEDWDPAGKSEEEKRAEDEKFEEGQPLPKSDKRTESREDDKQRSE